jgi:hypothetical protein
MTNERRVPDDPRADRELWDLVAGIPVPQAPPDFRQRLKSRLMAAATSLSCTVRSPGQTRSSARGWDTAPGA